MMPVMALGFSSDMPAKERKTLIEEEVKNKLERIDGVASADIMGGAEQEIQVTVDPRCCRITAFPLTAL